MTAQLLARTAYASPSAATHSARSIEYEAFARVTRQLKAGLAATGGGFAALARALHDNRTLWMTLAADVADSGNGLPKALRAQFFYLAEFTTLQTSRILSGDGRAEVLIDINMAVMRGLRGEEERA